jgi:hypothetical protein
MFKFTDSQGRKTKSFTNCGGLNSIYQACALVGTGVSESHQEEQGKGAFVLLFKQKLYIYISVKFR